MRLLNASVFNFGSYKRQTFCYSELGLALIQGRTGSGKSTIADIAPWVLFGVTAKNGNADEIRSWVADEEPAIGRVCVETQTGDIIITRIRGPRPTKHDLYWTEGSEDTGPYPVDPKRGKDMADTQRLLEERLGVSADLYLAGAYFHEFSPTGQFFTAKAKDRRAVFEGIADLGLPVRLAEEAAEKRKKANSGLSTAVSLADRTAATKDQLQKTLSNARFEAQAWEARQASLLLVQNQKNQDWDRARGASFDELEAATQQFEQERNQKLESLMTRLEGMSKELLDEGSLAVKKKKLEHAMAELSGSVCDACGQSTVSEEKLDHERSIRRVDSALSQNALKLAEMRRIAERVEGLEALSNPYPDQIEELRKQQNPYAAKTDETNPFLPQVEKLTLEMAGATIAAAATVAQVTTLEREINDYTQIYDLSFSLRGELVKKAVKEIEAETNRILETYFEGEIRVAFDLEGVDSLAVGLQKGGHDCVYRQLSKGQRGMLKLAFVVSIMKAASNRAGVHFANLWFDEALDGLDSDLKLKAFGLFEELSTEHESVLVIDHCAELQQLFHKRYQITMSGDVSVIEAQA